MRNIPSVLRLIVAAFFLSVLPVSGYALTPDQVFDKVKGSVVVVNTLDAQGKLIGQASGVLLPSGKIAANRQVVEGGNTYLVGRGKELVYATLYAKDADRDICLLDAKGITGKPAQLGRAAGLKVGDTVYAVGAPQGLELSLSDGIVVQLRGGPSPMIQTTAAISPGSSGGGLFDGEGRLVGLTTLSVEGGQTLNFAIPAEWIGEVKPGRKPIIEGHSQTEWSKRALALGQTKDWLGLLDWSRKWTKSEPKNARAWGTLGFAYEKLNRYNNAIEAYHQSVRINPEDAHVWGFLGAAYYDLKHYSDAVEAYRQAVRINPEDADAWAIIGRVCSLLRRYSDAIEAHRQAIRINPNDADAWNYLGNAYGHLNRDNDAIEAFRQAIRIKPQYADAWFNLGIAYNNLNRHNDAVEAFRQATRINPNDADAWFNLGSAYHDLERYDDAIEAYRQAVR